MIESWLAVGAGASSTRPARLPPKLGRFVDDVTAVPVRIANHRGLQIGRPRRLAASPGRG